jgi:hypothetical protein
VALELVALDHILKEETIVEKVSASSLEGEVLLVETYIDRDRGEMTRVGKEACTGKSLQFVR